MKSWSLVAVVSLAACVDAPAPPAGSANALPGATMVWDAQHVRPKLITGVFPVSGAPEAAARGFLAAHAPLFQLDTTDLALETTREGRAGTYLRFDEQVAGLPVFDGQVVVLIGQGAVRAVNLANHGRVAAPDLSKDVGEAAALEAARVAVGRPVEHAAPSVVRGVVAGPPSQLAYKVILGADAATWDVGVDAASGAILWQRDDNRYVNGTGLVYDVNPVSSGGDTTLTDNNDATSAALDAQRFSVTLPRLDGSGFLRGSFVDARPVNAANRASDAGESFAFDRHDNRFNEVNVYYHLDRVQDRIERTLGFNNVNNRVQVALVDGDGNIDNSHYDPSSKNLNFGTGGVDDAEDAEVVVHEYGHSCQDNQVPGWGGGDEGSMGEGFGDYLAGSMEATLSAVAGHAQVADPACLADWDAVSYSSDNPPCLRRLDGLKHDPEDADGEVHDDGEMWSAALWAARTAVGADVMDTDVLEAHFLLSTSETFDTAAGAIVIADQNTYAGAHVAALRAALYHQGVLRTVLPASTLSTVASSDVVSIANPVSGGHYANNLDDTQTYTHAGAQGLRLHFATLDTQSGNGVSCLANGCDNVYLYDGAGMLYQILHGPSQTNLTSVVIPGDTVQVRLVSGASTQRAGYTIDRVDVMGGGQPTPDAAPGTPDAAPGTPDAAPGTPDAAPGTPDADVGVPDADVGSPDAGGNPGNPDAGDGTGNEKAGGCCETGGGGGAGGTIALVAMVGAIAARRRRR